MSERPRSETLADAETAVVGRGSLDADGSDAHVGASLGRYVLLESVGEGGMGRVFRAYDPKLQREVALKVVRSEVLDPDARSRMLREARAMAKLTHPNVVAVYDAEESAAAVMLVMEYVSGRTLRDWVRAAEHPWPEILGRFVEAGRGLAAAHAQGLLHRDFKPANVLLAESGAIKVTDFGLAKLAPGVDGDRSPGLTSDGRDDVGNEVLTRTDTVIGTPRYMAPEQHQPGELGPAVDQYAFCVALWEALHARPPFVASSLEALLEQKQRGPPAWSCSAVPRAIAEAVCRGLAVDPQRRWPSMDALLQALSYEPAKPRRRAFAAVGVLGALGITAWATHGWIEARTQRCSGARAHLEGIWDEARQRAVEAAIEGTDVAYAGDVAARIVPRLDAYTDAWVTMHTEACGATTVRGEQSTELMDLRMACLGRAKVELEAAVRVLEAADAGVVEHAHDVVGGLPQLRRCADVEALQADVEPPPPEQAAAVEHVRALVATSRARSKAGRPADARTALEQAEAALDGIDYEPVATEVVLQRGVVLDDLGDYDAAAEALRHALRRAIEQHQWELARVASAHALFVVGFRQKRPEAALPYREVAAGFARGDSESEAVMHSAVGAVLIAQGKYAEAEAELRQTLALRLQAPTSDDAALGNAHNSLSGALFEQGKLGEAEAELRLALALREKAIGAGHPVAATTRSNLAAVLDREGKHGEALAEMRRALALQEEALGPDHPQTAGSRNNLGIMLRAQGMNDEAEAEVRRALASLQRALGPDHPSVAMTRTTLAGALHAQGKYAEAVMEQRQALAALEKALGPDHPSLAVAHSGIGNSLRAQGEYEEAEAELRRALAQREKDLVPDHPLLAAVRNDLAEVLLDRERVDQALALAEQAWARRQQDDLPPEERAATAFVLARALWARGGTSSPRGDDVEDHLRAHGLAERALAEFDMAGQAFAGERETVAAWLRDHR